MPINHFVSRCHREHRERGLGSGVVPVDAQQIGEIYGSRTEPSPESMEVKSQTAYEASKLARERYAEYYAHHYDMNMAGLRLYKCKVNTPAFS